MQEASRDSSSLHPAHARVGTLLKQKWRLDRLLGVGGMAAVYAATHRNGNRVAIKMLHEELSRNTDVRTRFLREGYLANAVDHEGAVCVIDDDVTEAGVVFLVMELLDGETVERRWERKGRKLPVVEVLSISSELLDVLAAAHAKGIVHRDIKPENAFLTREGKVKILDFGIARLRELSAGVERTARATTQTGAAMGTPAFMPPEQARGRWDEVDARTDVWATGATMFALLTGRFVHEAGTLNEQLLAAMTVKASPIASILPEVHPAVAEVIDRALAFRKEDRWEDARAMQAAIRQAYKASQVPESAIPAAPRFSAVDPDETETMAPMNADAAAIAMTAQALANAPSAAPDTLAIVARPRWPAFVTGVSAAAIGVALVLAAYARVLPAASASLTAMAPVPTSVEVSTAPPGETPMPPRPADEVPIQDPSSAPAPDLTAPSPPATGVPASVTALPPEPGASEHASHHAPPASSASDATRDETPRAEDPVADPSAAPDAVASAQPPQAPAPQAALPQAPPQAVPPPALPGPAGSTGAEAATSASLLDRRH